MAKQKPNRSSPLIYQRIVLNRLQLPENWNVNQQLQWFGTSLGLFGIRDRDKSCFRLFIELIKAAMERKMFSSDELSERLSLSRGTVVHHLNKLLDSGLVISRKNKYTLSTGSLFELVNKIKNDANEILNELEQVAKELDKQLR